MHFVFVWWANLVVLLDLKLHLSPHLDFCESFLVKMIFLSTERIFFTQENRENSCFLSRELNYVCFEFILFFEWHLLIIYYAIFAIYFVSEASVGGRQNKNNVYLCTVFVIVLVCFLYVFGVLVCIQHLCLLGKMNVLCVWIHFLTVMKQ